ncbi:hypothetical protein KGQ71_05380 [Patescibacteria group bacterium]|nr:hypothetical protein [Patescibacteria group bacterium]
MRPVAIPITLGIIVVLAVVSTVAYLNRSRSENSVSGISATSMTGQPTPTVRTEAVVPVTVTPTPTPAILPDSAQAFIANFFTAYQDKDRSRLATYFTPDTATDDSNLHSTLFTGTLPNGAPGGPNLFSTDSTVGSSGYQIVAVTQENADWVVTVSEQKTSISGLSLGSQTTLLTLTSAPAGRGTWLINSYVHQGASGKYNGFLLQ